MWYRRRDDINEGFDVIYENEGLEKGRELWENDDGIRCNFPIMLNYNPFQAGFHVNNR